MISQEVGEKIFLRNGEMFSLCANYQIIKMCWEVFINSSDIVRNITIKLFILSAAHPQVNKSCTYRVHIMYILFSDRILSA